MVALRSMYTTNRTIKPLFRLYQTTYVSFTKKTDTDIHFAQTATITTATQPRKFTLSHLPHTFLTDCRDKLSFLLRSTSKYLSTSSSTLRTTSSYFVGTADDFFTFWDESIDFLILKKCRLLEILGRIHRNFLFLTFSTLFPFSTQSEGTLY
jgi:hypothetical protein